MMTTVRRGYPRLGRQPRPAGYIRRSITVAEVGQGEANTERYPAESGYVRRSNCVHANPHNPTMSYVVRASYVVRSTFAGSRDALAMGITCTSRYVLSRLAASHRSKAMTAVETTKERWREADIHRIAGEIALLSPERDAGKAETYLERALAVAREQQAKSLELRAATSMARLWRDQGKPQQARELLAPVYGWFTEGFDTRDLREAKALLDESAA